jgi:hypothetical protein
MEVQQLTLQILAIHNEVISRNVVIGEVMVPLSSLDLSCEEAHLWRDIKPYHFQNVSIASVISSSALTIFWLLHLLQKHILLKEHRTYVDRSSQMQMHYGS